MSKSIEELRAQRELIQQHLNWLDARIRQAEDDGDTHQSGPAEKPSAKPVQINDLPNKNSANTTTPASGANTYDPIEAGFITSSNASDIQRIKVGCFVLFAAATLLFLFLLFGLPYLLN